MDAGKDKEWSTFEKRQVAVRLLAGEPIEDVSRETGIEIKELQRWRDNAARRIDAAFEPSGCRNVTCVEVVVILAIIFILSSILLQNQHKPRELYRRESCAENLAKLAASFRAYANGHPKGYYPALSTEPGRLMFSAAYYNGAAVDGFPPDPWLLACPSSMKAPSHGDENVTVEVLVDDHSYWYTGYALLNQSFVDWFVKLYPQVVAGERYPDTLALPEDESLHVVGYPDLPVDSSVQPAAAQWVELHNGLPRLQTDIAVGFFGLVPPSIVDSAVARAARSLRKRIPVIIEDPDNHVPGGGHVLYLDGTVEFIRYNEKWPMTEETILALRNLAHPEE